MHIPLCVPCRDIHKEVLVAILSCWPAVVIACFMTHLAGIVVWALVSYAYNSTRGRTITNVMVRGREGRGRATQKNHSCKGKLHEKKSSQEKKIHAVWESPLPPPPPRNFSNSPSCMDYFMTVLHSTAMSSCLLTAPLLLCRI